MENDGSGSTHSADSNDRYDISATHHVVLIAGHNKWEWVFLLVCIPSVVLLATCSLLSLVRCHTDFSVKDPIQNVEFVICVIAGVSLLFAFYGVFGEHQYEMYMHSLLLGVGLFCSWVAFFMNHHCLYEVKLVINAVVCVMCVCGFLFALKATHVPDWVEFRIIGVSDILSAMYSQLCYFLALLKADSAFMVIFALYSAESTYSFTLETWWVYQAEIMLYALISCLCGSLSIYKENKCLVRAFYLLNVMYPALITYQIYELFQHSGLFHSSAIVLGFLAILSKLYLIVQMHKSSRKFGYGLNTSSFRELVSRNSSNLLSRSRSALLF